MTPFALKYLIRIDHPFWLWRWSITSFPCVPSLPTSTSAHSSPMNVDMEKEITARLGSARQAFEEMKNHAGFLEQAASP